MSVISYVFSIHCFLFAYTIIKTVRNQITVLYAINFWLGGETIRVSVLCTDCIAITCGRKRLRMIDRNYD